MTVSVVIPVYNGEEYLAQAVESVLTQTYADIEIIAVDDGSTDNSLKVLAQFGSNIKVIQQENCGNVGLVRQVGVDNSSGAYIAFLDQDDWWRPEKISLQMEIMHHNEEVGLVHTQVQHFNEFLEEVGPLNPNSKPERMVGQCFDELLLGNPIYNSSVLVRKSAIAQVGGCLTSTEGNTVQDYDLWLRIAKQFSFDYVPVAVTCYRLHSGQGMWDRRSMLQAEIALLNRIISESQLPITAPIRIRFADLYDELAVAHLDFGSLSDSRICFRKSLKQQPSIKRTTRYIASLLPISATKLLRELKSKVRR